MTKIIIVGAIVIAKLKSLDKDPAKFPKKYPESCNKIVMEKKIKNFEALYSLKGTTKYITQE